ncbi:MAG: hypothetical protein PWQ12_708 [Clostridiales bacterium]|jgi:predicted murein hydrolase (TIGR00659 family)|nr:hypothetical protein [Clostridiales bacterium]
MTLFEQVITDNPAFGVFISIFAYALALKIKRRFKSPLMQPLIIAALLIVGFLLIFDIPYETYKLGGDAIHFILGPLTVALGISLYRQRMVIRDNFISLVIGITFGVCLNFFVVFFMSTAFGLSEQMIRSLLPKSITTPMALLLSDMLNGTQSVTVIIVSLAGIIGALMAPLVVRWFPWLNHIAVGIGIGTSSHALGTSKAIEMGEREGALSSTAIGLAGLISVLLVPLLYRLIA